MVLDDNTFLVIQETRLRYEFLTFLVLEEEVRVGVIQNETPKIIMFYDLEKIREHLAKGRFLKYADEWWWESNQSVPIDSFIGDRFEQFNPVLLGYPKKSVKTVIGPTFSLSDQYLKRIKKKRIELLNKAVLPS